MLTVTRVCAALIAAAALLAPAVWNGFPLLQWDTGGYLARWYEGYLVPSRSVVYGLFLTAGAPLAFWPVVAAQAIATLWVLRLALRAHAITPGPFGFAGFVAVLSVCTTLPWLVGTLITDIFAGLAVIGLHLLLARGQCLSACERASLIVLVAFSAATHSATLVVLLAVLAAAALVWLVRRDVVPGTGLGTSATAIVLSVAMVLGANYLLVHRLAWTPGGYGIAFGRLLQDGLVKRYLDAHCATAAFKLCPYRDELPVTADAFLWGNSMFDRLGRFAGLGGEMETIVLGSIATDPVANLAAATRAAAHQLIAVSSGEGVVTTIWHTHGMIERHTPALLPAVRAARQQHGDIDFDFINQLHVPVALVSLVFLPVLLLLGGQFDAVAGLRGLAATVAIAILANAAVCGILSGPHPRYGARLVWLCSLVALMTAWRAARQWHDDAALIALAAAPLPAVPRRKGGDLGHV